MHIKGLFKLLCITYLSLLLSGCGSKSFTLQSYADEYINSKPDDNVSVSEEPAPMKGADIHNPTAAKIMSSSTDKRDEKTKGSGAMQQALDSWLEEEWNPTFDDEEQKAKDKEADEHFSLQHYYDKRQKYLEAEEAKWKASGEEKPEAHYEKLERLPVIGK